MGRLEGGRLAIEIEHGGIAWAVAQYQVLLKEENNIIEAHILHRHTYYTGIHITQAYILRRHTYYIWTFLWHL